jgi:HD-GYP domain-containing protein (c-di-GMP phosphodiesterase class II)
VQLEFPFERRVFMGRERFNDLLLDDPQASRHHAVIYSDGDGVFYVEDLQSRNGTFLGEQRVLKSRLGTGQVVRIGSTELRLELPRRENGAADSLLLDPASLTTESGSRLPILATPSSEASLEDLRRAYRGLAAMYELGNLLHAGQQERVVYEHIVRVVMRTTGAELVTVAVVDEDGSEPVVRYAHPRDGLPESGFIASRTAIERVLSEGRAVLLEDVVDASAAGRVDSLSKANLRSLLCAPLRSLEGIRGFITAASATRAHDFGYQELQLLTAIGLQAGIALDNHRLTRALERSFLGTVEALVHALEAKDEFTAGHSRRVANISEAIAHRLGLPMGDIRELRLGALLHDIGMIGVSDACLHAPRPLTAEEYEHVQQHSVFGDTILRPILSSPMASAIVRNHHEHWDGGGYPDGLAGADIPLACRIVAVADAIDAITSRRPYRGAGDLAKAMNEVERCAGTQFDPDVVRALDEVDRTDSGLETLLTRE